MLKITFDKHWEREIMCEENLSEEELSAKENSFEEWVLNLMRALATNHYARVTFYSYRTALVFDEMFDADRESMRPLEYMLAIKAGVNPDNHTAYEVWLSDILHLVYRQYVPSGKNHQERKMVINI